MTYLDYHSALPQPLSPIAKQPQSQTIQSQPAADVSVDKPLPPHSTASGELSQSVAEPHWRACWFRPAVVYMGLMFMLLTGCDRSQASSISLELHQQWQLQPGNNVAGYSISSGLGDVVVNLGGKGLYMPKSGLVQPLAFADAPSREAENHAAENHCVAVSSPEIPAYRLRLCHLRQIRLGNQPAGQMIGRGEQVAISMLRKQPEGTWAFVEPSPSLLEALLTQP